MDNRSAPIKIPQVNTSHPEKKGHISPVMSDSFTTSISPNSIPNPRSANDYHASAEAFRNMQKYIELHPEIKEEKTKKEDIVENKTKTSKKQQIPEPKIIEKKDNNEGLMWDLEI